MKTLNLEQMERVEGGFWSLKDIGCGLLGIAAGLATTATVIGAATAPAVGALTTAGCMALE